MHLLVSICITVYVFQESYLNYLIFISCYSSDVPAVFNRGSQCRLQHCKEVPDHGAFAGHNAEGKLLRETDKERERERAMHRIHVQCTLANSSNKHGSIQILPFKFVKNHTILQ